uniref:Uncharacterized protein n=1 Tax=Globodera rostochiensis TaxID=31243 RepID=A0A914HQN9_GLORO
MVRILERYDTPHPKPFAPKNRLSRNSGDFTGTIPLSALSAHHQQPSADAPPGGMECQTTGKMQSTTPTVISHIPTPELLSLLNNAGGADGSAIGEENFTKKAIKRLVRKNVHLRKGASGFEWTIVGGANSLPYKGLNIVGRLSWHSCGEWHHLQHPPASQHGSAKTDFSTARTTTMAATMKMPPPVAPKPKHQQSAVVQLQQHQQKSSPLHHRLFI